MSINTTGQTDPDRLDRVASLGSRVAKKQLLVSVRVAARRAFLCLCYAADVIALHENGARPCKEISRYETEVCVVFAVSLHALHGT